MEKVNFELLDFDYKLYLTTFRGKPFTGVAVEIGNTGILEETTFKDGLLSGMSIASRASGQLISSQEYDGDILHGEVKEWYPDGQLRRIAKYEFGILISETIRDLQGTLLSEYQIKKADPMYDRLIKLRGVS